MGQMKKKYDESKIAIKDSICYTDVSRDQGPYRGMITLM